MPKKALIARTARLIAAATEEIPTETLPENADLVDAPLRERADIVTRPASAPRATVDALSLEKTWTTIPAVVAAVRPSAAAPSLTELDTFPENEARAAVEAAILAATEAILT